MSDIETCSTCAWAKWQTTAHAKPRVRKDHHGQCLFPIATLKAPMCVPKQYPVAKHAIWYDSTQPCQTWLEIPK